LQPEYATAAFEDRQEREGLSYPSPLKNREEREGPHDEEGVGKRGLRVSWRR
jgi:hypothetical protein